MFKIGNLKIKYRTIPAPLASITDIAFRKLLDEIGCMDYMVTEMISAEGLRRGHEKTLGMIRPSDFKTPQFIQLFGSEPSPLIDAVKYVENETQFQGVDINMGCPAIKVVRKDAGAALLKNPRQVAAIVAHLKKFISLPLTIKIRLGFNKINVLEIVNILEQEGVDAITVHFRLRCDGYSNDADWSHAPAIREIIKNSLFIGNGDINTTARAKEKLNIVDAVMIGRGAVMNPLIFREIQGPVSPNLNQSWVYKRLLELIEEHYTPQFHLPRLKAYARFFLSNRKHSKKMREKIYTSKQYSEARKYFLEFGQSLSEPSG